MNMRASDGRDGTGFDLKAIAIPAYGPALFFGAAEGVLFPVIPASAHGRGAGIALAAFVAMLLGLGSWAFNVPAGIMVSKMGERRALLIAGVVGALGALLALIPSLIALMAGMFILGLASAVYLLARQKYLTEAVPMSFRARALSLLGGVNRIGVFVGPMVGSFVIGRWGTASAFWLAVVFLTLATACSAPMADLESGQTSEATRVSTRTIARRHAPVFRTVGVGILLVQGVRAIRQVVIPLWCAHIGLDAQQTSVIYALSCLVDMLVFYPAGKVMDVRGRAYVAVPAMTIMGACLLAMPLTHTPWMVGVVSCVLGFGNGIGSGMVMTLGADFSPDAGRATFLGLWRQLGDTGATLGPLMLSGLTALVGLAPAVLVSAGFGVGAAAILGVWPARLQAQGWGHGNVPAARVGESTGRATGRPS